MGMSSGKSPAETKARLDLNQGTGRQLPQEALLISTLTLGEIHKSVELLPDGRRRSRMTAWLETQLPASFVDRVSRGVSPNQLVGGLAGSGQRGA